MRRLLDNVADIKAEAAAHPQRLMRRDTVLTVLGRIASATGPDTFVSMQRAQSLRCRKRDLRFGHEGT